MGHAGCMEGAHLPHRVCFAQQRKASAVQMIAHKTRQRPGPLPKATTCSLETRAPTQAIISSFSSDSK